MTLGEYTVAEHKALHNLEMTMIITVKRRWWHHHLGLWVVRLGFLLFGFGKVQIEYNVNSDM